MKRFNLLLVIFVSTLLASCYQEDIVEQAVVPSMDLSVQPKTWQEQLEYAKSKSSLNASTRTEKNGIRCINYTYKGRIETEAEKHKTIEQLFSDNAATVQYISALNYEIVSVKTMIQESKALGITNDIFAKAKSLLEDSIQIGMELIEIEWLYKGEIFYSTAIATNERGGILYDNIGYLMLEGIESEERTTDAVSINSPMIKTRGEYDVDEEKKCQFYKSDNGYNYYHVKVWSYDLWCTSDFNKNGILCSRRMNSSSDSALLWDCQVGLRTVSGEIDVDKFHEFAWAYAYGPSLTVSVSWNGVQFSASGGGSAATGTEVHRSK